MGRSLCLVIGLLLGTSATAQDLVADAWGLADPADATRAGWAGLRDSVEGRAEIMVPSTASDVLLYVGQKSLVAGEGMGQAAALILDARGNLVADGTEATFTLDRVASPATSLNGIAALKFRAGTRAGQYHAGATAGRVQSLRSEYEVIPDLLSITPGLEDDPRPGQVEAFHDYATGPLADRFGNPVAGGTGTLLVLRAADGSVTLLPGQATGGAGVGRLLARDLGQEAGLSGTMSAIVGVNASAPTAYRILPLRAAAPLEVRSAGLADPGLLRMTIGPFLTDAGHVLNDGAPVQATLLLSDGRTLRQEAWLMDGRVVIDWLGLKDTLPLSLVVTSPLGTETVALPSSGEGQP